MRDNSIKKLLCFAVISTIVVFGTAGCKKDQEVVVSGDTTINKKDNKITSANYEASVYFNGDHYVLNVFTNLFEGEILFRYDDTNFLLDDTGIAFENAVFTDEDNGRSCKLKLESNTLYEFNFIKTGSQELVIGENIFVEEIK